MVKKHLEVFFLQEVNIKEIVQVKEGIVNIQLDGDNSQKVEKGDNLQVRVVFLVFQMVKKLENVYILEKVIHVLKVVKREIQKELYVTDKGSYDVFIIILEAQEILIQVHRFHLFQDLDKLIEV